MATDELQLLVEGLVFPESPRWHQGRLWFSDMLAGRVMTVDAQGRLETIVGAPGWLSGLGWLPDGRLLAVSMQDRRLLRLDPNGLVEAADLTGLTTFICNDMVVDEAGRAYVGEVGFDVHGGAPFQPARLVLVEPDSRARVVDADLACPNGTIITPDGRTLIVGESLGNRLTAFDVAADGSLGAKRIWAAVEGLGPDGICLDAEGAIWVASPMKNEVVRVLEGGRISHRLNVPSPMPLAVMLGGDDRRMLYICRAPHPEVALTGQYGRIDVLRVDVPGAGLP
ncbi:MAG: SMP-30/gluconolactonase/LRE family protein [Gammaproteobacteria bacterium]|nr:SMP-30/gluconolactonase/LRE family protein [Gammaproteobacteria bacterium]